MHVSVSESDTDMYMYQPGQAAQSLSFRTLSIYLFMWDDDRLESRSTTS